MFLFRSEIHLIEYKVVLPDGRLQIVTYRADHEKGYFAEVKYENQPNISSYSLGCALLQKVKFKFRKPTDRPIVLPAAQY